jgi:hypothetical protein
MSQLNELCVSSAQIQARRSISNYSRCLQSTRFLKGWSMEICPRALFSTSRRHEALTYRVYSQAQELQFWL